MNEDIRPKSNRHQKMNFYLLNVSNKLILMLLILICLFSNYVNALPFIESNSISLLSKIQNGQMWPPPPTLHSQVKGRVVPPHCSKSIITESQSSRRKLFSFFSRFFRFVL